MECGSAQKYAEKKYAPLPISHRKALIYFAVASGGCETFMLLI
jgi:hypothetical protein